jgi:hypothetical protein
MEMSKIIRETKSFWDTSYNTSYNTKIFKKTYFGKKLIHEYNMLKTEYRTLGFRESIFPSVAKEYGTVIKTQFTYNKIK